MSLLCVSGNTKQMRLRQEKTENKGITAGIGTDILNRINSAGKDVGERSGILQEGEEC